MTVCPSEPPLLEPISISSFKTTLVSSGEDGKTTLVSSGEDGKTTLVSGGEDGKTILVSGGEDPELRKQRRLAAIREAQGWQY